MSTSPAPEESTTDRNPVIAGYRIGAEMGRGPLGKIYRAEHVETGEHVVFRGFTRPEKEDAERWKRDKDQFVELLSAHHRIDAHPTIQKIIAYGEEGEMFWVASEYFVGRSIQEILHAEGAQSLPWAIEVLGQVAQAVDYAGERGLCHTDLTPFNVLLVNDPVNPGILSVKVINFGLAHARSKFGSRYAAPEQQTGFEGNRRSDVYSIGALLYEIITGSAIFSGATAEEIARKVVRESPHALRERPAFLQNVLSVMLAKNPEHRYEAVAPAIADLFHRKSPQVFDIADPVAIGSLTVEATSEDAQQRLQRLERDAENKKWTHTAEQDIDRVFLQPEPTVGIQQYKLHDQDVVEIRARRSWFGSR